MNWAQNGRFEIDGIPGAIVELTGLAPGTAFRIVRVDPSINDMLEYLDNLGIGLETTGIVVGHAPFNGPVTLCLTGEGNSREAAICREVAGHIYGIPI